MGRPGRVAVYNNIARWREEAGADAVFVNGENASGGVGLSSKNAVQLLALPIDAITSGNHIFKFKDLWPMLRDEPRILRPGNYPAGAPGRGIGVYDIGGVKVGLINLQGRTYMDAIDCPFAFASAALDQLEGQGVRVILADFHAEATSEKQAMGWHMDGRASALVGTHTHVPTADARVLAGGTAYITDLGMCGPQDGCLGMDREPILQRFKTGLPTRFQVAQGPVVLQGAVIDVCETTGRAEAIEPFFRTT